MQLTTIQTISMWVLPVLFAITVHEVAHGYVAYLLGDKTAQMLGRLTLNPVKHIDIVGTVLVPLGLLLINSGVIFGWAKPVPVSSHNLKHLRRDFALIAAAGPIANLLMAFIWAAISKGGIVLLELNFPGALAICMMGKAGVSFNVMLMVLNLLPIPRFDGGHVLLSLLPTSLALQYERLEPYSFLILFFLLATGAIDFIMQPAVGFILRLISVVFGG